jgi:hypothetical protein
VRRASQLKKKCKWQKLTSLHQKRLEHLVIFFSQNKLVDLKNVYLFAESKTKKPTKAKKVVKETKNVQPSKRKPSKAEEEQTKDDDEDEGEQCK